MKFIFLTGGFAGFLPRSPPPATTPTARPTASSWTPPWSCLVGALLFRWFWTVLVRGIR